MLIGRNNSDSREVPNTWLAEYIETSRTRRIDGTHCKKGHRRKVNKVTNLYEDHKLFIKGKLQIILLFLFVTFFTT
jgi:hypothetical protein